MSNLGKQFREELQKLSLKDYFKRFEASIDNSIDLKSITDLFTTKNFIEEKPYLIRRMLMPIDNRFKNIEIVYDHNKKVKAIVWELKISLQELNEIFGEPIVYNEPYSNTTAFAFKSNNKCIEIIKTRFNGWLKKLDNEDGFEDESKKTLKIYNPEFNFIQFSLMD